MVSCKSYPSTFTLTLNIRVGDSLLFSWTAGNTLCCGRCVCQGPLIYWIFVCFLWALPQTIHTLKRPDQGVRNSKKQVADWGAHTANAVCVCRGFFLSSLYPVPLKTSGFHYWAHVTKLNWSVKDTSRGAQFSSEPVLPTQQVLEKTQTFLFKCSAASIPRLKDKQQTTHAYCMCECAEPMSLPVWLVFVCSLRSFYVHIRWPDFEPQGFAFPLQQGFAHLKIGLWLIACLSWVAVDGAAIILL